MNEHEVILSPAKQLSITPLSQATLRTVGEAIVIGIAFWKLLKVIGLIHVGTKPVTKKKGRK